MFLTKEAIDLTPCEYKLVLWKYFVENKYFRNSSTSWKISSDTKNELDFVFGKSYRDFPYAILLSRPATGESVILDVNLGGLGPYLKLYNSGRKNVLLVESLIKEYGEENFVTKYLNIA